MYQRMDRDYVAIFGEERFELLGLILYSRIRNIGMTVINEKKTPLNMISALRRNFFMTNYVEEAIEEYRTGQGLHKGLFYKAHEETIELTLRFYDEKIKQNKRLVTYYNKILSTNKFEAYVKKEISYKINTLLKNLHLMRLSYLENKKILAIKDPINKLVIEYMASKYAFKPKIKWVLPLWRPFFIFVYYGWLIKECLRRGVVFNKSKLDYKLAKDVLWGFFRKTTRDDIVIDNNRFKINDMLLLRSDRRNYQRERFFKEAKERGFDTASIPELKININRNIFKISFFYFLIPIKVCLQLFLDKQSYLVYYIILFHKRCFPIELLMNLYNIKCYLSFKNGGEVEETIILNKYGTICAIFHWSDLALYKTHNFAFIAHNVYFVWGDIHYDYHSDDYFVDKKINIGCIYKEEYRKALKQKESIIAGIPKLRKGHKTVAFFDNPFSNTFHFSEQFFLNFLEIIKDFCKRNKDVNTLLKPKNLRGHEKQLSEGNLRRYKELWSELEEAHNFIYLNPLKYPIEDIISISDICVNMGLTTPSTIALICGKNGLYFDSTGNKYHPLGKKYKDILVFEDKGLLLKQMENILDGKFNCRNVLSEKEIRAYDAFSDDSALERLRDNLYTLTL